MKEKLKRFFNNIKRYSSFVDTFKAAAKSSADPAMAYVNWGIDLAEKGEFEDAIEKFAQAASISPEKPEPFANWGVALAKMGRYEAAIEQFKRALQVDPNNMMSLMMWGSVLIEMGDMANAGMIYQQAIQMSPSNPEPFVNWGIALARLGQYEQAIHHFRSAIALFSYQPHVYFLWGAVLTELEQYEEAIEKFKTTVKHMPKHPEAYYFWALVLNRLGHHEEAIEKSRLALELIDDNPEIYLNMGDALANLGKYETAIDNYRHATHLDPNLPDAYLSWGIALCKLGKYDEATSHFQRALELDDSLVQAHFAWGVALNETHRFEEALPHLTIAHDNNPTHLDTLINYGLAHIHTRQLDKGFALLKQAEKVDKWNPQVQFLLGTFLLSQNEPDKAKVHLERALEFKTDFTDAAINLSLALCDLGDTNEAIRTLRPFIRSMQDSPEVNFFYGTILLRHGSKGEAIEKYKKALSLRPNYRDALLSLVELYMSNAQWDLASEPLSMLEEQYPEFVPGLFLGGLMTYKMAEAKNDETLFKKAQDYFQRIIAIEPMHLEANVQSATIFGHLKELEAMNTTFVKLLDGGQHPKAVVYRHWIETLDRLGFETEANQVRNLASETDR